MIPVSISLIKVYVMQVLFVYFLSKLMPQILMVWIHFFFFFFKKRNDIVIVLTQPGQNYFKTCFLFLGVMSHFFSDTDNKKTAFCSYLSSLNCFFFSF